MDKNLKKQVAAYDSDTPVILKQGQDHQTWYKLVEPKQCYNSAQFEKTCLNSVCERANDKAFATSGNTAIISLDYVRESKIVVYS